MLPSYDKNYSEKDYMIPFDADYMIPLELLYRDVDSLEVSNLDKKFVKVGSEILPFHHTRTLVKLLRRTYQRGI